MDWMRRLLVYFRGRKFSHELDSELGFHIDMRARALEDEGLAPDEARRRAHLELGNTLQIRENSRDVWFRGTVDRTTQDLRFGWRSLRRSPTFTTTVVLTLALGIGGTTAIFSVVDAVLLKPFPWSEPDRVVLLWSTSPAMPAQPLTPGNYYDYRQRMTTVTSVAGLAHLPITVTGAGPAQRQYGMSVSSDFFEVLGATAAEGRTFGRIDGPDSNLVVLADRYWRSAFNADPTVVGKPVTLNGKPYVISGVMSRDFALPSITPAGGLDAGPDMWISADQHEIPKGPVDRDQDLRLDRRMGFLRAIARLKPGVSVEAAQEEAASIAAGLERDYPTDNARIGSLIKPFSAHLLRDSRRPLAILFVGVGLVLAIACANVASLLLARVAPRRPELAMRLALGASKGRIVRQLLTESLLLGAIAGAAGLVVGSLLLKALVTLGPDSLMRLQQASLDARAILFAGALALITAVIFGVLPALQASRTSINAPLLEGSRRVSESRSRQRFRRGLVSAEMAAACVLLLSAGLIGRSLWTLLRVDPGYDSRQVLTFELFITGARAEYQRTQLELYEPLLERLRIVPGVVSAGAIINLPVGGDDFGAPVVPEGAAADDKRSQIRVNYQVASANYFQTMNIPMREGRDFNAGDTRKAPGVAIVNEAFGRHFFPDGRVLGRRLKVGSAPDAPWRTIVGIVGDVRHGGFSAAVRPEMYEPYTQYSFPMMSFVVRTAGDPLAMRPVVQKLVAEIDPSVPVSGVSTLDERLSSSVTNTRFLSFVLLAFAGVAVLVASIGVYGVVALGVVQRTREIGVRLALGATRGQVLGLLLRQGLISVVAGLVVGVGISFAAGSALEGLLFGVTRYDAATFTAVPLVLAMAAIAAAYLPARRAVGARRSCVELLRD